MVSRAKPEFVSAPVAWWGIDNPVRAFGMPQSTPIESRCHFFCSALGLYPHHPKPFFTDDFDLTWEGGCISPEKSWGLLTHTIPCERFLAGIIAPRETFPHLSAKGTATTSRELRHRADRLPYAPHRGMRALATASKHCPLRQASPSLKAPPR